MAIKAIQDLAKKLGANKAEGSFKFYDTNNNGESRSHLILKCNNLPLKPAIDISLDLPGDSDKMVVQGLNYGLEAALGNEDPPTP
ncbi:MAG: hypothetical protein E6R03_13850 [Hyphomicrobiaceae bacterium]|nr:MAG: hypothetical protein E6R03_13850 [Hyphomicrobiaceae bacterium]